MPKLTTRPIPFGPFSVLVVNDRYREALPDELRDLARSRGGPVAVDTAESYETAMDKLRRFYYHAVYCDFFLAEPHPPYSPASRKFGTRVLEWVKANRPSARRVLTTAHVDSLVGFEHWNAGRPPSPEDYLVPFTDALSTNHGGPFADYCLFEPYRTILADLRRAHDEHRDRYPLAAIDLAYDADDADDAEWAAHFAAGRFGYHTDPLSGELFEAFRRLFATYRSPVTAERTWRSNDPVVIDRLEVSRLSKEGKSGAAVLRCTPCAGDHRGTQCVVKVDHDAGIRKEAEGFDTFVKYHRSNVRRVEMLSWTALDTLGGACYTFAGGATRRVFGLYDLMVRRDLRAIDCLHTNYHPSTREWFAQVSFDGPAGPGAAGGRPKLAAFFDAVHFHRPDAEPIDYATVIRTVLRRHVARFAADHGVPDLLGWGFVEDRDTADHRHLEYDSAIVHGDMNASNLITVPAGREVRWDPGSPAHAAWAEDHRRYAQAERDHAAAQDERAADDVANGKQPQFNWPGSSRLAANQTIVIDYQFTMRGPAFIDFAALEVSLRLSQSAGPAAGPVTRAELERWADTEARVSQLAWADRPYDHALADADPAAWHSLGYWGAVSYELQRLARRNFEETYPQVLAARGVAFDPHTDRRAKPDYWHQQYAATCLYFVARILKSKGIQGALDLNDDDRTYRNPLPDAGVGVMRLAVFSRHLNLLLRRFGAATATAPRP